MSHTKEKYAHQLALPLRHDKDSLTNYLKNATGRNICLTLTDNTTSMLSVIPKNNHISVRLQRIFLDADLEVIDELAEFIRKSRGSLPLFRRFLRENLKVFKNRARNKISIKTSGDHHDLKDIYRSVNENYFGGRIAGLITWGTNNSRRFVRKRTLGSYDSNAGIIRINSLLDSRKVPRYFVSFVVYHEMLHADMGVSEKNGRRSVHSSEFRRRERAFGEYAKAIAWERKNI